MKTKKSLKKLSLNKETIAQLNGSQMQWVVGGYTEIWITNAPTKACPRVSVEIPCQIPIPTGPWSYHFSFCSVCEECN